MMGMKTDYICKIVFDYLESSYYNINMNINSKNELRIYNILNCVNKIVICFHDTFLEIKHFNLYHVSIDRINIIYDDPSMFDKLDKHITSMHYVKNA